MNSVFTSLYTDPLAEQGISDTLAALTAEYRSRVAIVCIGTDSNIPDSLGPLIGTMLVEKGLQAPVYGTLDQPLHARNMMNRLNTIRAQIPGYYWLAIDASLGKKEEVGLIEIKKGGLLPGRAFNRNLPLIGDISILGKVGNFKTRYMVPITEGRLGMIYAMARTIANGIWRWEQG
ncbi:MAG: spore protease YyaC [Candidatus Saccharibacteria bacterium]